jgi:hypothetical protein
MDQPLNPSKKVVMGCPSGIRGKFTGILNTIVDEHILVISLLATLYVISKVNFWVMDSYLASTIMPFIVVFIICDYSSRLLINLLRKTLKPSEKMTDKTNSNHNLVEVS